MRGPKPKPTKLKILHGSREPINEAEPKVPAGFPVPLSCLSADAKREWERLSTFAHWITIADRGLLTSYCVAWGRLVRGLKETQRGGIMLKGKKAGGEYQNQWEAIVKRASADVARYGALLGLDPSSRTRIDAEVANGPDRDGYEEERRRNATRTA